MAITKTNIMAGNDGTSTTITVEQAQMVTIGLRGFDNLARGTFELQDDLGGWQATEVEISAAQPTRVLFAPGEYRLVRRAGAFGAFKVV